MKRIYGFDLLRAIAIVLVVLMHSAHLLDPLIKVPVYGPYLGKMLAMMQPFGLLGVELFFILSGFLIGEILIKTFDRPEPFNLTQVRQFWVRRWFRTLPNYYLILLVIVLIYVFLMGETFDIRYLFFLQNFSGPMPALFPESWSLAIEEWFYLLFPLLLLLVKRVFKKYSNQKVLALTIAIFSALFFLYRIGTILYLFDQHTLAFDYNIRKVVVCRLDSLAIGIWFAYLSIYKKDWFDRQGKRLARIAFCSVILLTLFYYIGTYPSLTHLHSNIIFELTYSGLMLPLLNISFALFLPYCSQMRYTKLTPFQKFITIISKSSYSIYLIHFSLVYKLIFEQVNNPSVLTGICWYIAYWTMVIFVAYLLNKYFEVPMLAWREKFSGPRKKISYS